MGRKTSLNPDVADALVEAYALGVSVEKAAAVAGISEATVYEWRERSTSGKPRDKIYADLFERIKHARALGIKERLKRIKDAATGGQKLQEVTRTKTKMYNGRKGEFEPIESESVREYVVEPNWMADKWWLEHVEAKDFASISRTELTGKDGEALPASNVVLFLPDNGRDAPQPDSATMNNAEST